MKIGYSEKEPLKLEKIDMYVWQYRWNIHTEEYTDNENWSEDCEPKTHYVFNYVDLYVPFNSNTIISKVISETLDITKEQKLINEYNEAIINGKKTNDDKGDEGLQQSPDSSPVTIARKLLDVNNGQQNGR